MKTCSKCNQSKDLEAFSVNKTSKDGRYSICKGCRGERRRESYKDTSGAANLKYYHNITPERFNQILEAQGGVCRLCDTDTPGGSGTWHVDHDHACCPGVRACGNCIRGLLCSKCNLRVGQIEAALIREKQPGVLSVFSYIESRVDDWVDGVLD